MSKANPSVPEHLDNPELARDIRALATRIEEQAHRYTLERRTNNLAALFTVGLAFNNLARDLRLIADHVQPASTPGFDDLGELAEGLRTHGAGGECEPEELEGVGLPRGQELVLPRRGLQGVTPSDAQRTKIRIACDLSLMDLAEARGIRSDLAVFDEVLDGCDDVGTQRMLQLLALVRERRSTVLVISHEAGMSEDFEGGLCVVKSGGSSRVESC